MNVPALPLSAGDLIEEYNRKSADIEQALKDYERSFELLGLAATVRGTFVEPVGQKNYLRVEGLQKNLLRSGWKAIYSHLGIDNVATAKDRALFEHTITDPPELTVDNAKATFGDYMVRPRFHVLRGLAEVLTSLDPAYRSHSNVKIGVKGLPKRIVLNGWGSFHSSYAQDRYRDLVNALAVVREQARFEWKEMQAIDAMHKEGDAVLDGRTVDIGSRYREDEFKTPNRGLTIRKFKNGNVHVYFDKWTLLDINRALAEFYGEVIPDVEPDNPERAPSTEVAKDLQFYWSPPEVIDNALQAAGIYNREQYSGDPPIYRVLEPSCGEGHILDELRARRQQAVGIEYDPGRATQSAAKGHNVLRKNFLEVIPRPDFDRVVMNPPFYGTHYAKHVRHAMKFLKPGGILVAILPASAHYDHKLLDDLGGKWSDLPVASFADAGTNVPTGLLTLSAPKEA